jgi:hypothetical protein
MCLRFYTLLLCLLPFLSFKLGNETLVPFSYPKRNSTAITMWLKNFNSFDAEWRGSDYLFKGNSNDSVFCTVLYYKLNSKEQQQYGGFFAEITDDGIENNSNSSKIQKTQEKNATSINDFVFKQKNIYEENGLAKKQKHMYALGELDKDLLVIVHLYKNYYTSADSINMSQMIHSIKRVN